MSLSSLNHWTTKYGDHVGKVNLGDNEFVKIPRAHLLTYMAMKSIRLRTTNIKLLVQPLMVMEQMAGMLSMLMERHVLRRLIMVQVL